MVTKSGHKTYGLDTFFSGLLSRVTKSVAIFTLSIVDVDARRAYPMSAKQVVRSQAEKEATKAKKKAQKASAKSGKKAGRPKGSKNRDKTKVTLTAELQRIQKMVHQQLSFLPSALQSRHLALDDTLVITMRCKWCVSVVYISFPNCVTMRLCISFILA